LSYNPNKSKNKVAEITRLSLPILVHIFKEILKKSKFLGKRKKLIATAKTNVRQLYTQAVNLKITDILKFKEDYPNLPAKKIENIHRIINNVSKSKPHIKPKAYYESKLLSPWARTILTNSWLYLVFTLLTSIDLSRTLS